MKILYHGEMGAGHHARQRADMFDRMPGVDVVRVAIAAQARGFVNLVLSNLSRRLRLPLDLARNNASLLLATRRERPDVVFIDNAKTIRPATLATIKRETGALLVYSSPDDITARHNSSRWLERSYPLWDVFFTTKTFNVGELSSRGVRHPHLVGNMYNPDIHLPLAAAEAGEDFERFDIVFVGTHEREREDDLRALAHAGFRVLVHGNPATRFSKGWKILEQDGVTVRPAVIDREYTRAMHHGKIAMGFLRKINRDLITQRSIEAPAMGRVMLAERTAEHDAHFRDGVEYAGFSTRAEMIEQAGILLADDARRDAMAKAARARCETSPYDIASVTAGMLRIIRSAIDERRDG